MANPVGYVLSRLIRQRSYVGGDILALQRKLARVEAALQAARADHRQLRMELKAATERMAQLDAEITAQSEIHPAEIYARKAVPKRFSPQHGSIVAALVDHRYPRPF